MSETPCKVQKLDLSNAVSIQHVEVDTISEIRKLQLDSYMKLYAPYATDSETSAFIHTLESAKFAEEVNRNINRRQIFGAFLDDRMIGIAAWSVSRDNHALSRLRFLCVDPMFTRCKVGQTLLKTLEQAVKDRHNRELSIRTAVQTMGFFEKSSYATTSYGAYPLGKDEAFAAAFMRKSIEDSQKITDGSIEKNTPLISTLHH